MRGPKNYLCSKWFAIAKGGYIGHLQQVFIFMALKIQEWTTNLLRPVEFVKNK